MALVEELKKRITSSVKEGDTVARDVLRLALGEIQTAEARKSASLSEEEAAAALRKLVKSNEETLGLTTDAERSAALKKEIEVLTSLLPKSMSVDEIVAALASQVDAIKAAKADGQAVGVAMKHLKSSGASVSGNDVQVAVKKIRG
jgi:uncharacterized protein YqeY